MPEDRVSIQTPLEPMRRPLLVIVFCYLAGTFAGVILTGPDFPAGFIVAVLALISAFILHAFGKYVRVRNGIFFLSANAFVFLPCLLPAGGARRGTDRKIAPGYEQAAGNEGRNMTLSSNSRADPNSSETNGTDTNRMTEYSVTDSGRILS